MTNTVLAALIAPNAFGTTLCTIDGTPYKTDTDGLVYVKPQHLAEMVGYGYSAATTASPQVPPGDPVSLDQGW